jgi:GNAT superfamily N-acetyltransferase
MHPELDLGLARALEQHAVEAWPATVTQHVDGGWLLRATPGLERGRSNHALTPVRNLSTAEIPEAIARVEEFARVHGIVPGIQVSPLSLHGTLQRELDRRGWGTRWPVLVLAAARDEDVWSSELVSSVQWADHATPGWLGAWARCEPGRHPAEIDAHAATVFRKLAGKATFARLDERAVGIAVEREGIVGLFCVAVDPAYRRTGLGTGLVRALLARSSADTAYLQVAQANSPAVGLYAALGFTEAYQYCHRIAPAGG